MTQHTFPHFRFDRFELLKVHVDGGPFEGTPRAEQPLSRYAHVTLSPGAHKPARMRDVALQVSASGGDAVLLPAPDGRGEATYACCGREPAEVRVLAPFCM